MKHCSTDIHQERYLAHQAKKKNQLAFSKGSDEQTILNKADFEAFRRVVLERRTQRLFNRTPITPKELENILSLATKVPNSCNRQSIYAKVIESRDEKDLLSGLLVGGVGWCHRADKIILLFANENSYKAGDEILYMPYLDAGVVVQQIYLTATALNIGCAYINPNIRENNQDYFSERFGDNLFCGALALGNYDIKVEETPKKEILADA